MDCDICSKAGDYWDFLIYEEKHWTVYLSPNQAYLGRCAVILNQHVEDMTDLTGEQWRNFAKVSGIMESAIRKAFNATLFNWSCLMNNAFLKKEPHPHVHWHMRPRYNGTRKFDGRVFDDREFGHHYDEKKNTSLDKISLQRIADAIKDSIGLPNQL